MSDIIETIQQLRERVVITQGEYSLTADAMKLRGQRPLHCGDDYELAFTFQDEAGDPVDLTGAAIKFTAKYAISDTDLEAVVQKDAVVSSTPLDGGFTVTLLYSDVVGPEFIQGSYDIQKIQSSQVETIIYGPIEFLPNVTQTTP